MTKETSLKTVSSVNLPIGTIQTIINVDDRRFDIPIEEVSKELKKKDVQFIRTYYTVVDAPSRPTDDDIDYVNVKKKKNNYFCKPELIKITNGCSYIYVIEKRDVLKKELLNNEEVEENEKLKFYKINIEYATGICKTLILPAYVKLYSSHKGEFTAIEHIHSGDILMDYSQRMVKTDDAVEVKDYEIPDKYWNIKVTYEKPNEDYKGVNFYIDGLLANVSYYNFNGTSKENQEQKEIAEPLATIEDYKKPVETTSDEVGANAFATALSEVFK